MPETIDQLLRDRDELKDALERLSCELEQTTNEKNLSAQYGLDLLEEKRNLNLRFEELESMYDSAKAESDMLREALAKYQTNQKITASSGIEQEESLLLETASIEASFAQTVLELERELKQTRQENVRVVEEKERILQENIDLAKNCDLSEWEKRNYKTELKDLKLREARLQSDNNELEEENISLQKQISNLRSSQVEFEGAKHEVRCLLEDLEASKGQIEELMSLKKITEKQLEEALEALQSEREQKYAIKKELDQHLNNESIFNISNLGFAGFGLGNFNAGHSDEELENESALTSLSSVASQNIIKTPSSTAGDLFSELQMSEVRKLEKQLELSESEKSKLSSQLQEIQQQWEKTKQELTEKNSRVHRIVEHINEHIVAFQGRVGEIGDANAMEEADKDIPEIFRLKHLLTKHEERYQLAVEQVEQLQCDVRGLQQQEAEINHSDEGIIQNLRNENQELKVKIQNMVNKINELENDLSVMAEIARESGFSINFLQEDIVSISEELAQLYHHVCMVNGETPNRIILDHVKGSHISENNSSSTESSDQNKAQSFGISPSNLDNLKEKLKSELAMRLLLQDDTRAESNANPSSNRMVDTIRDQVNHLTKAIENTLEICRQKQLHTGNQQPLSSLADAEDLQEQVLKLKSLLSTKREQIATLRTVLKANKHTAEVALANLKSKYENEKAIVSDTMMKLRNDLKSLKEDKATFASLRAMFAARCEEYATQIDEYRKIITNHDDEVKTMNTLLKMAITEKLMVKKKIEELEGEAVKNHMRRPSQRGRNSYPRGGPSNRDSATAGPSTARHSHDSGHFFQSRRDH